MFRETRDFLEDLFYFGEKQVPFTPWTDEYLQEN